MKYVIPQYIFRAFFIFRSIFHQNPFLLYLQRSPALNHKHVTKTHGEITHKAFLIRSNFAGMKCFLPQLPFGLLTADWCVRPPALRLYIEKIKL